MAATYDTTSPRQVDVVCENVTVTYGNTHALGNVTTTFRPGVITALCGPNGAGKTTLARAIAGWLPVNAGTITVAGQDPRGPEAAPRLCYTDAQGFCDPKVKISHSIDLMAALRPTFDRDWCLNMLEHVGIKLGQRPQSLSTGKRAALATAIGLACRADITALDETHNGMDANTRDYFLQTMLADYAEHPRTIILSSHLINEIATVAEDVTVVHQGALMYHGTVDDLKSNVVRISGPADAVDASSADHRILSHTDLGSIRQVLILRRANQTLDLAGEATAEAESLQDAVVALTSKPTTLSAVAGSPTIVQEAS